MPNDEPDYGPCINCRKVTWDLYCQDCADHFCARCGANYAIGEKCACIPIVYPDPDETHDAQKDAVATADLEGGWM